MPPPRYRIVERGGRLEVVDGETGERPLSAAERMAAHDAAHGHAAMRYDRVADAAKADAAVVAASPATPKQPTPMTTPSSPPPAIDPIRAALAQRINPWNGGNAGRPQLSGQSRAESEARPSPGGGAGSQSARSAPRATSGGSAKRQPFVTGKWWDSKGPRTVDLSEAGRTKMNGNVITVLVVAFFALIALVVIQPALLLIAGFALFRFGDTIIGPIGAWVIDEAIKADGGR